MPWCLKKEFDITGEEVYTQTHEAVCKRYICKQSTEDKEFIARRQDRVCFFLFPHL